MISIIVAVGKNNVIGKDNALIWHLPADMKFFKEKTMGHVIITGRKNYESIPEKFRPLPNRTNIVITKQKDYQAPGAVVVDSIEKALELARKSGDPEIFIIGGAEIFRQTLQVTDRIYLTEIHHDFEGDVFFPEIDRAEWKETTRTKGITDEKNKYAYDFITLDKIS
jgi:dihydrofolate reductase